MYTASDVIEHLLDSVGGGAQDHSHRVLRQAVFHAYRDLVTARDWRWYETSEQVSIDTVYFEHVLPWGVQSVDSIAMNEPVGWNYQAAYLEPRDFNRLYANTTWNSSTPAVWTVDKSTEAFDRYRVRVLQGYQWPATGTLTYRRRPRDLRYTGFEPNARKGLCSWNQEWTASLTSNKWRENMVGCVLRIIDDTSS